MPKSSPSRCDYCSSPALAIITAAIGAPEREQPRACRRCLPREAAIVGHPLLPLAPAVWSFVGGDL